MKKVILLISFFAFAKIGFSTVLNGGNPENSSSMSLGRFKMIHYLEAVLKNFDFDAKCEIQSYEITRVRKREDVVTYANQGAGYSKVTQNLVDNAKSGDIFYYDNIKARCPGDPAGRAINSLVVRIK
jgi:hypothetical protein